MAIEIECLGPCAPNDGTTLPDNQMPFLVPPGSGGGGGSFVLNVVDTSSVDLEGKGTQLEPLQATVKVSTTLPANMVQIVGDGVYVPHEIPAGGTTGQVLAKLNGSDYNLVWVNQTGGGTPLVIADSASVDLGGDGTGVTPLMAAVKLSSNAGNGLSIQADGLFVTAGAKGDTGDSIVPNEYGILTEAKITAIQTAAVDWVMFVNADNGAVQGDQRANQSLPVGIVGDMAGHLIRWDQSEAKWTDLGLLAGVAGPAGPGFAPGGTTGQVLAKASNTDYDTQWIDDPGTTITVTDTPTIDLGGNGSGLTPLSAALKIDPVVGNMLVAGVDGVSVAREIPPGGTAGQVLKKVNATDYNYGWADDAGGLTAVTTDDTPRVVLGGAGTAGDPLVADIVVATGADQVLTAEPTGLKVSNLQQIVVKPNTAQTAILGDTGKYLRFTNTSAKGFTIPLESAVAFQLGASMSIFNAAATGNLTISAASGVTITKAPTQSLILAPGKAAYLVKVAANEWDLVGGMEPA